MKSRSVQTRGSRARPRPLRDAQSVCAVTIAGTVLNEQIWPVPSDFVKSRFHCIVFFDVFSIMVGPRARRAHGSTIIDMVSHGFLGHFFCHHSNS